jgi:hypothetical protein
VKKILFIIIILTNTSLAFAQTLHFQTGWLVPDKDLKNMVGNGPEISMSILMSGNKDTSYIAEVGLSYFQQSHAGRTICIPGVFWNMFIPIYSDENFFVGPGIGVSMTQFRSYGLIPTRGIGAENNELTVGGSAKILCMAYNFSFSVGYTSQNISGLPDSFNTGGIDLFIGYYFSPTDIISIFNTL